MSEFREKNARRSAGSPSGAFSQNANHGAYGRRSVGSTNNKNEGFFSGIAKNFSGSGAENFAKTVRDGGAKRQAKIAANEVKSALFDQSGALKLSRKHRPDYAIVVLILILAITGLVVLFSIAPALNGGDQSSTNAFMFKQAAFLALGISVFFIFSRIPLDFWRRNASKIFIASLLVSVAVAIPHFPLALNINGAQRWFNIGAIGTFQPAEFLKFGSMLFASGFLAMKSSRSQLNSWRELFPFFVVMGAALFVIVVLQKDMGTGLALFAIVLTQLIIARVSWRKIAVIITISFLAGLAAVLLFSHRMDRVMTFFGGGDQHQNYQINQAMIAIGSGGLTGKGLGQSVQAFGWLPEQSTDSIFAILCETLGWAGALTVIVLFGVLLRRILVKTDYTENLFLRLILAGVFGWITAHVVLNIGAMTSLIPLTGVTLPLISFGGTSMMFIMGSLGLVFAISGYTTHRRISTESEDSRNSPAARKINRRQI